jgi:RimJ/RimL family protein N-acetyltransferase
MRAPDDPTQPMTIELTTTGEFVGVCGFLQEPGAKEEWEIYCLFRRKHWYRGFATEVTRAQLDAAFRSLGAKRVTAIIDPGNAASIRLVGRVGFCRAGAYSKPGSWQDGHLLFVFDGSTYNLMLNADAPQEQRRAG